MILTAIIMLVLALVLLAYILEPVLRADDDHVEIDAAIDAPPVPDFRALLDGEDVPPESAQTQDEPREPVRQPEPAEHRS